MMPDEIDLQPLRKWIHDLNNRVAVILTTSELLQLEQLRCCENHAHAIVKVVEPFSQSSQLWILCLVLIHGWLLYHGS